jgi:membrane peptidoglycan carboxypeptidase
MTRSRRRWLIVSLVGVLAAVGLAAGGVAIWAGDVDTPDQIRQPATTTLYYSDGTTVLAQLGEVDRYPLAYDDMVDAVPAAAVAALDPGFWDDSISPISRAYARIAYGIQGGSWSDRANVAVLAHRLEDEVPRKKILEYYLNAVPFGRNAYGIEAAAAAYFGKSARGDADAQHRLTPAEAIFLAARLGTKSFADIKKSMIDGGAISAAEAGDAPTPLADKARPNYHDLTGPAGLVVPHVLAELTTAEGSAFRGWTWRAVAEAGLRVVTTLDVRVQKDVVAAADQKTPDSALFGQPANLQAAVVVVEPGTGRVLGYYGGPDGTGSDFAGIFRVEDGGLAGFGAHRPGTSFAPYTLVAALKAGISADSAWPTTAPASVAEYLRDLSVCANPCRLSDATARGIRTVLYGATEKIGAGAVIDVAQAAGVEHLWDDRHKHVELAAGRGASLTPFFDSFVGVGRYPVTVLDQANGMATFGAGGVRATAHFVRAVYWGDHGATYSDRLPSLGAPRVLSDDQAATLARTLVQTAASRMLPDIPTAAVSGFAPMESNQAAVAHAWTIGYTTQLAVAVWVGNRGPEQALRTAEGRTIYGSGVPASIFQRVVHDSYRDLGLKAAPLPS